MPIISSGNISNDNGPKYNPREEDFYVHNTVYTDPPGFCSHIAWSIYGDIPVDITIDSGSGVISGKMYHFGVQPSCQDNKPKATLDISGKDFDLNGRFKQQFYDFHFTIQRDVLLLDGNGACSIPLSETSSVFIRLVKNHDIDNVIFMNMYVGQGFPVRINNQEILNPEIAKALSPGPFLEVK